MTKQSNNNIQEQEQDSQQRIALLLDYLGTNYHGSQHQPEVDTVQSQVVSALNALGITPESFSMAGRTDAGVHSRGQVAHFEMPREQLSRFDNFIRSINTKLPDDIQVKDYKLVPKSFHSRRNSAFKWYRYKVYNAPRPTVWMPPDAVWVREPLDIEKMNTAVQLILGEHNFKSFKSVNTPVKDDVCDIIFADVYGQSLFVEKLAGNLGQDNGFQGDESPEEVSQKSSKNPLYSGLDLVTLDIVSNRFLYKMVRNLMGQLIEIGKNPDLPPQTIVQVLQEEDRTKATVTAPACGLCKMATHYPSPDDIFSDDPYVKLLNQLVQQVFAERNNQTQQTELPQSQLTEQPNHVCKPKNIFRQAS